MNTDVLRATYEILRRVDQGAYSDRLLQSRMASQKKWTRENRALLTATMRSVLENRRRLDWILDQRLKKSPRPRLRIALRLGLQLLEDGRAPHAVLSELLRALAVLPKEERALLNGVLRAHLRDPKRPEDVELDPQQALALKMSLPPWLPGLFKRLLGKAPTVESLETMMTTWRAQRKVWFRLNPQAWPLADALEHLQTAGLEPLQAPESPLFLNLGQIPEEGLHAFAPLQAGAIRIQDLSTLGAIEMLQLPMKGLLLEFCAAPGGKTLALLDRQPNLLVIAVDRNEGRVEAMKRRLPKSVDVRHADVLKADLPQAAAILLDAPCSGSGSAAHRPEIFLQDENPVNPGLLALQADLLDRAAELLFPGGILVYSTCSLDPRENMKQVEAFLERHEEFALEPVELPPAFQGKDGAFYALPFKVEEDHDVLPSGRPGASGAFAVRLRKGGK
jgi:16S rRNA (cytosine967-C5)-methyltransferase